MGENNNFNRDEEINLYQLFQTIKNNIKFIVSFVFGITILATILTFFMKPVYKSEISIFIPINFIATNNSIIINYNQIKSLIDEILSLHENKQYEYLSKKLNISLDNVLAIENIKVKDSKDSKDVFYLSLYVYDKNKIPQLTDAILKYINKNPVIKSVIDSKLREIDTYIDSSQKEIVELEAVKRKIFKDINSGKISLLGVNPVDIEISLINLKSKIEILRSERQVLQRGITLLSELVIPNDEYKPKIIY